MRSYLLKGGFVIFDDFRGQHWDNLQDQMQRVLPEAHWIRARRDGARCSTRSSRSTIRGPSAAAIRQVSTPSYWGLFEDNDPKKRLMAIANVNNDISEYWEFSDTGVTMVDLTNEAYKFGVNYVIYGLTH